MTASAPSPGCDFGPPQVLAPERLTVLSGTVKSPCAVPEPECLLDLVLDLDQSYLRLAPEGVRQMAFVLDFDAAVALNSAFSIKVTSKKGSWDDVILVRNWVSGEFENKTGYSVSSGNEMTTVATVFCSEAANYMSSSGDVEVQVVSVAGYDGGQSDKWVDKVEIEIPPPM